MGLAILPDQLSLPVEEEGCVVVALPVPLDEAPPNEIG